MHKGVESHNFSRVNLRVAQAGVDLDDSANSIAGAAFRDLPPLPLRLLALVV